MKRFIRYLYEYEQAKRIRNVGFVKVESGDEETIVHMQGKGFHDRGDRTLLLYLFCAEKGEVVGIWQTEVQLTTPVFSQQLQYSTSEYGEVQGVLIETSGGRRIAATWDDQPIDVERIKLMSERPSGCECEQAPEEQEVQEVQVEPHEEEEFDPAVRMQARRITKIQRKDISMLPRCEWKMANNQFLMHGYHNYHHLLLIEEGNYLKLGVPGIYHIEEAKFADMFGFEEFLSADELQISQEEDEDKNEFFGYWCRLVRKGRGARTS